MGYKTAAHRRDASYIQKKICKTDRSDQTTVCDAGMCAGCMACVAICPRDAILVHDDVVKMDAVIDEGRCIGCGLCHKVCQRMNPATPKPTLAMVEGWADPVTRKTSTSGGYATAIMRAFVNRGGYVASCRFEKGAFGFAITNKPEELERFAGSKYVKSDPGAIYTEVKAALKSGFDALFIGLPCQVSAMRNYVDMTCARDQASRLYTIDLICHGTPSAAVLKQAMSEYGKSIDNAKAVMFREGDSYTITVDGERIVPKGCEDAYIRAFLGGFCFTLNCHACTYSNMDRVGDLTLGDSWGSVLTDAGSDGISLALVHSEKGKRLLEIAQLTAKPADPERAIAGNRPLRKTSDIKPERDVFFSALEKTGSVKRSVFKALPKRTIKQNAKCFIKGFGKGF